MTLEMGQFAKSLQQSAANTTNSPRAPSDERQFAVLLGGRLREDRAVILQHPLFDELLTEKGLPLEVNDSRYQVRLDDPWLASLRGSASDVRVAASYDDPLGQMPDGEEVRKKWIAVNGERFSKKWIAATAKVAGVLLRKAIARPRSPANRAFLSLCKRIANRRFRRFARPVDSDARLFTPWPA